MTAGYDRFILIICDFFQIERCKKKNVNVVYSGRALSFEIASLQACH